MMQKDMKHVCCETTAKPHEWPLPSKVLVTTVIIMMAIGLAVAAVQIGVHDVIPAFRGEKKADATLSEGKDNTIAARGDLFSASPIQKEVKPFYQTDEFIFALKFSHIHIFGMSAIFILMGAIVAFLDLSFKVRIWLIVLPFIGVVVDLISVWLKLFVHPAFFWLHIPGGALFGTVFAIDSVLILRQLWVLKS